MRPGGSCAGMAAPPPAVASDRRGLTHPTDENDWRAEAIMP
jgi:hypothetical protein